MARYFKSWMIIYFVECRFTDKITNIIHLCAHLFASNIVMISPRLQDLDID
jgi:hypothetical protein